MGKIEKMGKIGKNGKKLGGNDIPLFLEGLWLQNSERGFMPSPPPTLPPPLTPKTRGQKQEQNPWRSIPPF